jgi:hypothetical protein
MFEVTRWCEPEEEVPAGVGFFIGVDLGQSNDYTAICVTQKVGSGPQSQYFVRRLERERGRPYPDVVARVRSILTQLPGAELVIDSTGVGAAVADMFRQVGMRPICVHIHAGTKTTRDDSKVVAGRAKGWVMGASRDYGVPKADLVAVLQVLLQNQRLKIAHGPLSDVLTSEMLNFRSKIDPTTAHESFSSWRENQHDDLVLATALSCWWAQFKPAPPIVPLTIHTHTRG